MLLHVPTSSSLEFPLFTSPSTFGVTGFSNFKHSNRQTPVSHCKLLHISVMTNDTEHLFVDLSTCSFVYYFYIFFDEGFLLGYLYNLNLFYLLRLALWPRICSILVKIPWLKECIFCSLGALLFICQLFQVGSVIQFTSILLIFYILALSVIERGVWKSPILVVDLFLCAVLSIFASCILKLYYFWAYEAYTHLIFCLLISDYW